MYLNVFFILSGLHPALFSFTESNTGCFSSFFSFPVIASRDVSCSVHTLVGWVGCFLVYVAEKSQVNQLSLVTEIGRLTLVLRNE